MACLGTHPIGSDYCPGWPRFDSSPSTTGNDLPLLPPTPTFASLLQPFYQYPRSENLKQPEVPKYAAARDGHTFIWETGFCQRFNYWQAICYPFRLIAYRTPDYEHDGDIFGFSFGEPDLNYIDAALRDHLDNLQEVEAWRLDHCAAARRKTTTRRFKEYEYRPRSKRGTSAGPLSSKKKKYKSKKELIG